MLTSQLIDTPVGSMTAIADDRGLVLFEFSGPRRLPGQLARVHTLFGETPEPGEHTFLAQTRAELDEYFAGRRKEFSIPLVIAGTPFQESVWRELLRIPFGATVSYHQIATRIGRPGSARAVGRANGDNRIAIIIPCHRVIGSNGSLTGYGGGEPNKRWLLDHEQRGGTHRHPEARPEERKRRRERSEGAPPSRGVSDEGGSAFQLSVPVSGLGETPT